MRQDEYPKKSVQRIVKDLEMTEENIPVDREPTISEIIHTATTHLDDAVRQLEYTLNEMKGEPSELPAQADEKPELNPVSIMQSQPFVLRNFTNRVTAVNAQLREIFL